MFLHGFQLKYIFCNVMSQNQRVIKVEIYLHQQNVPLNAKWINAHYLSTQNPSELARFLQQQTLAQMSFFELAVNVLLYWVSLIT